MNTLRHFAVSLAMGLALGVAAATPATPASAEAKHYVCPPCGLPCDTTVFDAPGVCPKCGMALVDQEAAQAAVRAARKVAILIFDGVEIIDYTGPYEVFGAAGFEVYTVAQSKQPVTTAMGMTVVPKYTFADAPAPDVLLVPGGGVKAARGSQPTLQWVRDVTARAQHTMSVCNGAFILADARLLDGLTATTTAGNIERLRSEFPKTRVVSDRRFVDNGRIITTAGLAAGIDGALHVVSLMLGQGTAQQVALSEEYDWRPGSEFARAALADLQIPNIDLKKLGDWETVSTQGEADRWQLVFRGTSSLSPAQLMDQWSREFETRGKWASLKAAARGSSTMTSRWKFSGRDGKPWNGTLVIRPVAGGDRQYTVSLNIARVG